MPLLRTTLDRGRDAAWAEFFAFSDRLRTPSDTAASFLTEDDARLLDLPNTLLPFTELHRARRRALARGSLGPAPETVERDRARASQAIDLLGRLPGLTALLGRLPLEPPHHVPCAPHADRGTMVIRTDIAEPASDGDPSYRLVCQFPGPLPDHLPLLLSTGRDDVIGLSVARSALLYTALFTTIRALASVDQMRIPTVRAALGRSQGCNDTTVQLACWFRIGDNLRVLVSPKFTTMGDAIVAGCSHAILFVQPWMNQHPPDSHSWWLSLAEHSYTHFHSPHGLYHRAGQVFTAYKADGSRSWMYYGDHAGVLAARSFLGPAGRLLGGRAGKTFYPSGPPEKRVAYSDSNQSFVSFVSGEWPFDAGSPAVVVINAFQSVLGHEVSGLRARMQREMTSAP